jgi:hypothetical protein
MGDVLFNIPLGTTKTVVLPLCRIIYKRMIINSRAWRDGVSWFFFGLFFTFEA